MLDSEHAIYNTNRVSAVATTLSAAFVNSEALYFHVFLSIELLTAAPLNNCSFSYKFTLALFIINRASASFLFYVRVAAVYQDNRLVRTGFFLLYLCVIGGTSLSLVDGYAEHMNPTKFCIIQITKPVLLMITSAIEIIYDMLICVAITYKLRKAMAEQSSWKWPVFSRRTFQRLSQRFLQDSQIYIV